MKYIFTLVFLCLVSSFVFASTPLIAAPLNSNNSSRERVVNFEEVRNERINQAHEKVQQVQERVEEKIIEKIEERTQKQEEFRNRLEEIKDERVKNRARILSGNINRINNNLSNRYTGLIGAMEIILDKLESRTNKIEEEKEVDLSGVYEQIDEVKELIERIKEDIIDQKSKTYVVELTSEDNINLDFQNKIREMRQDHENLKDQVHNYLKPLVLEILTNLKNINQ